MMYYQSSNSRNSSSGSSIMCVCHDMTEILKFILWMSNKSNAMSSNHHLFPPHSLLLVLYIQRDSIHFLRVATISVALSHNKMMVINLEKKIGSRSGHCIKWQSEWNLNKRQKHRHTHANIVQKASQKWWWWRHEMGGI